MHVVLATFLLVCVNGCADRSPARTTRILWPLPPHTPQLEFVGVVANDFAFERPSTFTTYKRLLFGEKAEPFFERPFAVAVDSGNRALVTDSVRRRVRVLDLDRQSVTGFAADFVFRRPMGIAVDAEDRVYVADGILRTVCVFAPDGKLLRTIGDETHLANPSFIEIDVRRSRLYVADAAVHTVNAFTLSGEWLYVIGGKGNGAGEFFMPQGMAIDGDGRLYVADTLNSRLQIFDTAGRYVGTFAEGGANYWQLEHPRDLAYDERGNLFLVDYRKSLLNGYRADGELLVAVGRNQSSRNALAFASPTSLAIDGKQRIYVTDTTNKRISVWQILTDDYLSKHAITDADYAVLQRQIQSYRTAIEN